MGIAKEQARAVLPEGLMQSRIYMNGTLRSWIHYIDLRSSNGTQKEHREIARACADEIVKIFPDGRVILAPPLEMIAFLNTVLYGTWSFTKNKVYC